MTNLTRLAIANQNIQYYVFIRIFAKRVFLPLTAIYFMDWAGFNLVQIGYLAGFFSLVQLLAEVPTGYFADRVGRIVSLRLGALLAATATTLYVVFHDPWIIVLGVFFEALGYSFMGGAGEALIHDSLIVKNQTANYTKVMSRTMSISLLANAILVALVPLTYPFDNRLPFLIGTICYIALFVASLKLQELFPPRPKPATVNLVRLRQIFTYKSMLLFGLTFGIVSALYTSATDTFNIALKSFGTPTQYIGLLYGGASLFGALLGPFIHLLKRLKVNAYAMLDGAVIATTYFAASFQQLLLLWPVLIFAIGFWRYRRIIYQDYVLQLYPDSYKATLISTLNNLEQLNAIWLPLMITSAVGLTSFVTGFRLLSLFTIIILPFFYLATAKFFRKLI